MTREELAEFEALRTEAIKMKAALIKILEIISFFPTNRSTESILKIIRGALN